MKKILAVSGGVDSMVMMHLFRDDPEVAVAHFNHGTRESCYADEEFVRRVAGEYGLPVYVGRAKLGAGVSEEQARISRYEYLEKLAVELGGGANDCLSSGADENEGFGAVIYMAHHGDDLIETMAINLIRGTGWRGLTPFSRTGVKRPFLETNLLPSSNAGVLFRKDIYDYAAKNNIVFRQDPTNTDEKYLRNRVRILAQKLSFEKKMALVKIYHEMNNLRTEVDEVVGQILGLTEEDANQEVERGASKLTNANVVEKYPRAWFNELEDKAAIEILKEILARAGVRATRPQMLDFLRAIREYPAGRKFNLPKDRFAKIGTREFIILN